VARRIAASLNLAVHGRAGRVEKADVYFPNALDHVRALFAAGVPVIGVCAAGILIRAVAPMLANKQTEPALLAVPDDGGTVIPLLGGHHGANRLARRVAGVLAAKAAITTAGDVALGIALDEPPEGWVLANPEAAKGAMMALLQGGGAEVCGDAAPKAGWLSDLPKGAAVKIVCSVKNTPASDAATLVFHPRQVTLGVGCARHCPPEELDRLVTAALEDADISPKALRGVYTLDLKADEPAVLRLRPNSICRCACSLRLSLRPKARA